MATEVECLDNYPRMEVRDLSEQMATYHLSPPPLIKGGGRLSKGIWEIIKERNPQGAKDLRELAELNSSNSKLEHGMWSSNPSPMMATTKRPLTELNSRQYKLEHGMSSGNPSPMMATTKRPLAYVDCFDNHSRMVIPQQIPGYDLWGSPPPQKKGRSRLDEELWEILKHENPQAKNLDELFELSRRESALRRDRLMPIWKAYHKEVDESEGFDVSDYESTMCPPLPGMIVPMNYSKAELADKFNVHCKSAIELYNQTMGAKFKLVEIEKANFAGPRTHFITFTASEENDEPKVFQAEHLMGCPMGPPTVTLCRQKGDRLGGYRRTDMYP